MGPILQVFQPRRPVPLGLLAAMLAVASGPSPLRADDAGTAAAQGNRAYSSSQFDQAIAEYSEAIRLNPNDAVTYATRGMTYQKKGDYDLAIADFSVCIRLNPDLQDSYIYRGLVYELKGDHSHAIADYNRAIRLNPDAAGALVDRAIVYSKTGYPKKAVSDYKQAIYSAPDFAAAYNDLAWLLATCPNDSVRNGSEAVKDARKACDLTKWNLPMAIDTLAAAYAETGDFDSATKWEMRYLQFNLSKHRADGARQRLALYQQKQPYREVLTGDENVHHP
jgi:tetratricopeptide (TPR) repeat protein